MLARIDVFFFEHQKKIKLKTIAPPPPFAADHASTHARACQWQKNI